jgi:hypothetical protein
MDIAKGSIQLDWKNFNVNLEKVFTTIKELDANCCGISANTKLEVHGVEAFAEANETAIKAYWESVESNSIEATSYYNAEQFRTALEAAKADAVTKSFDQLSVAQKKILFGQAVTAAELGL